ncbi:MAG: response regulator transcription factor [Chthoniobacterales bacterium]|nr:response regulator transcription factor [Chthoniobacterales bacterium]
MRVLVVEDEKKLGSFLRKGLTQENLVVDLVHAGDIALERLLTHSYDAVVLDIMLPGRDGLSVLREMRRQYLNTPVLLLSARGNVNERVEGLNLGADDYLSKPCSITEVVARVRALLRRAAGEHATVMQVADLSLNVVARAATRGGRKVELTNREFALLEYLMAHAGRVITKTSLCEHVWEHHFDTGTNVVEVCMQRLRRKIDDGYAKKLLHTVRGTGYALRGDE